MNKDDLSSVECFWRMEIERSLQFFILYECCFFVYLGTIFLINICGMCKYGCPPCFCFLIKGFLNIQCKREGFLQKIKDEEGEGCNIYGFLEVNKVAGNFHFAPGKSFQQSGVHVHDLLSFQKDSFNVSHILFAIF